MSNDNNELKNSNESCEGKRELTMEELEQVTGGAREQKVIRAIGSAVVAGELEQVIVREAAPSVNMQTVAMHVPVHTE